MKAVILRHRNKMRLRPTLVNIVYLNIPIARWSALAGRLSDIAPSSEEGETTQRQLQFVQCQQLQECHGEQCQQQLERELQQWQHEQQQQQQEQQ